jgi:hypothetical protein
MFKSIEDAKCYGENFGSYHYEHIQIKDQDVILCGTDKAYEEALWGDAYELVQTFCKKFHKNEGDCGDTYNDFSTDMASKIRDVILEEYEKKMKTKFVDVYDEY